MTLPPLDELEVHSGLVFGPRRTGVFAPGPSSGASARSELEAILREALEHPPVYVSFSGGRDSSAILALATHVARRDGLLDPVPLTAEYDDERSKETDWQELVIGHLGLREWRRFHVSGEVDALGELAVGAMRRHGPFWPPMAHNMLNIAAHASGGTLLTGGGGDELLERWSWRRHSRDQLRALPLRRRAKWTAFNALPLGARQRVTVRRRGNPELPWLTRAAEAELVRRARAERRGRSFAESIEIYLGGRYYELLRAALTAFAADNRVRLVEPFYDPRFALAAAREAPAVGFQSRTAAFERFFGDVLPEAVVRRSTKAAFSVSLWGTASRAFAANWDGGGLDPELVDCNALRAAWTREPPDVRALVPLQHAYWRSTVEPTSAST